MMVMPSANFSASRIMGTPVASQEFNIPVTTLIFPWLPTSSIPMGFGFYVMASSGHTSIQPPQLWQTSENTIGFSLMYIRAWKRQKSTHCLHPVHLPASKSGNSESTESIQMFSGFRNNRPLGSSTSQSMYVQLPAVAARFTATSVLPAPPLPLKQAIFIFHHGSRRGTQSIR